MSTNNLDLTTPQKDRIKVTVKITSVEKKASIWFVGIDGQTTKLKAFPKQAEKFLKAVEVGAEAEAEISVEESEHPDTKEKRVEAFLRSFGGSQQRAGGGGSWGGGKPAPKEFAAELAPSVGGIYNHGIDKGLTIEQIEVHANSYIRIMNGCRAQSPAPVQTSAVEPKPTNGSAKTDDPRRAEVKAFAESVFGTDEQGLKALEEFKGELKAKGLEFQATMINAKAARVKTQLALQRFVTGSFKGEEEHHGAN